MGGAGSKTGYFMVRFMGATAVPLVPTLATAMHAFEVVRTSAGGLPQKIFLGLSPSALELLDVYDKRSLAMYPLEDVAFASQLPDDARYRNLVAFICVERWSRAAVCVIVQLRDPAELIDYFDECVRHAARAAQRRDRRPLRKTRSESFLRPAPPPLAAGALASRPFVARPLATAYGTGGAGVGGSADDLVWSSYVAGERPTGLGADDDRRYGWPRAPSGRRACVAEPRRPGCGWPAIAPSSRTISSTTSDSRPVCARLCSGPAWSSGHRCSATWRCFAQRPSTTVASSSRSIYKATICGA